MAGGGGGVKPWSYGGREAVTEVTEAGDVRIMAVEGEFSGLRTSCRGDGAVGNDGESTGTNAQDEGADNDRAGSAKGKCSSLKRTCQEMLTLSV